MTDAVGSATPRDGIRRLIDQSPAAQRDRLDKLTERLQSDEDELLRTRLRVADLEQQVEALRATVARLADAHDAGLIRTAADLP